MINRYRSGFFTNSQKSYNYLPYPYPGLYGDLNGVNFSDIGDGRIKVSGIATAGTTFSLFYNVLPGISGNCLFSGCLDGQNGIYKLTATIRNPVNLSVFNDYAQTNNPILIDIPAGYYSQLYFYIYPGKSINTILYPMITTPDNAGKPWTPYKK